MAKKVLYRSVIQIEILSEEPIDETMPVEDILEECTTGSYSGVHEWKIRNREAIGRNAAKLTLKQGSGVEFFNMDADGNELEENY